MSSQTTSFGEESLLRSTTNTALMSTKTGGLEQIDSSVKPEKRSIPIAFSVVSKLEGWAKTGSSLIPYK